MFWYTTCRGGGEGDRDREGHKGDMEREGDREGRARMDEFG